MPYRLLYPAILLCCTIGAFSTNNSMFDVWVAIVFGLLGYIFMKLGCEPAPLLLGYILGPMLEENLRRALVLPRGPHGVRDAADLADDAAHCLRAPGSHRRTNRTQEARNGVCGIGAEKRRRFHLPHTVSRRALRLAQCRNAR